jgi:predicted transcriptional regulator
MRLGAEAAGARMSTGTGGERLGRGRGELEQDVMTALWARTEPVTARTVLQDIGDSELAYTTVKTVLDRLTRKQVVNRSGAGRTWYYTPAASRDEYVAELMLRALDRSRERDSALVRFARAVTPAEAEVLRAALDPDRGTS